MVMSRFFVACMMALALALGSTTDVWSAASDDAPGANVVDFEDLSVAPDAANWSVTVAGQYSDLGLSFTGAEGYAPHVYQPRLGTDYAHSGVKVIGACRGIEFCSEPITIVFSAPQSRVKAWVGTYASIHSRHDAILRAYDSIDGGELVASATAPFEPTEVANPVQTPLEVTSDSHDIRRVDILMVNPAKPESVFVYGFLAVDDIEFDVIGPAPTPVSCPVGAKRPAVRFTQPEDGASLLNNHVWVAGEVSNRGAPLLHVGLKRGNLDSGDGVELLGKALQPSGGDFSVVAEGYLEPGLNKLVLTAENCIGSTRRTASVSYDPIEPGASFEVVGSELTQAIQDLSNSVPLVVGKRSLLRVYLRSNGANRTIDGVYGKLRGCRRPVDSTSGKTCLGSSHFREFEDIYSSNSVQVETDVDINEMRLDLDKSLNFELPPEWVSSEGPLYLQVVGLAPDLPCMGCMNLHGSVLPRPFGFVRSPNIWVGIVEIHYPAQGQVIAPPQTEIDETLSWLERAYPTANVVGFPAGTVTLDEAGLRSLLVAKHDETPYYYGCRLLDRMMVAVYESGLHHPTNRYYGVMSTAGLGGLQLIGCAGGGVYANGPVGYDAYIGHEIGHTYGRGHPYTPQVCGDKGGCFCNQTKPLDPSYPYVDQWIGGRTADLPPYGPHGPDPVFHGYDAGDASVGASPRVVDGSRNEEVMTYCLNSANWVSAYTYVGILDWLSFAEGAAFSGASAPFGSSESVFVGALLDESGNQGTIRQVLRLPEELLRTPTSMENRPFPAPSAAPVEAEGYGADAPSVEGLAVTLMGSEDQSLASYPVDAASPSGPLAPGGHDTVVAGVFPWVDGVEHVALTVDGAVVATREVSRNSPTVAITDVHWVGDQAIHGEAIEVRWSADDLDEDALSFDLLFSGDEGVTWRTVATGLQEQAHTLAADRLPGGGAVTFRVIANDGVNGAVDEFHSDLEVPDKAPVARIQSPIHDSVVSARETIVLTGEGYDLEDGVLDASQLKWYSSLDGYLGSGRAMSVPGLLEGSHRVTLVAGPDSGGQSGQATALVHVEPAPERAVRIGESGPG